MPLAELGLVSRFDETDAPLLQGTPQRSQRVVRCAAGFYPEARQALQVADELRRQYGLSDSQLSVIQPEGLTRDGFRREAARWQQRRPRWAWRHHLGQMLGGVAAGLVSGGMAAVAAYGVLATPDSGREAWTWLQAGLWTGAVAGLATTALLTALQPRRRFDVTVARKLQEGYVAVVAHGLSHAEEAPVLARLQNTSRSWCAEAPQRPQRL